MEYCSIQEKWVQDNGVGFTHLVEIGSQDKVDEKFHAKYHNMRYALSEPDPAAAQKA